MENLAASVRFASGKDVEAIAALVNRAADGQARTSVDEVSLLVSSRRFVVLDDHQGVLAAAVSVEPRGEGGWFSHLSVQPERQGQRLGTRMVAIAEAMCQAMGCASVAATIDVDRDDVPNWYRRMGYAEDAPQRGRRHMRKALAC